MEENTSTSNNNHHTSLKKRKRDDDNDSGENDSDQPDRKKITQSPMDYVLEKRYCEMPDITDCDGGD